MRKKELLFLCVVLFSLVAFSCELDPPVQTQAEAPVFSPKPGVYTDSVSVSISTDTAGASIYYTTDGSEPTEASLSYTAAVSITQTTTLKARVYKAGLTPSSVTGGIYTITSAQSRTATPVISPEGGVYTSSATVTITCSTPGAKIYYTTDGTNPTETSTEYTAPLSIDFTCTLKAVAKADDYSLSLAASKVFTISVMTVFF